MQQTLPESWQLWALTLCYGHAGILAVAPRMHARTDESAAARVAAAAAELTLAG